MTGVAQLTFTTIRHWRLEMGMSPLDPREIDALLIIDGVMCFAGAGEAK